MIDRNLTASLIERFLSGAVTAYEFDDFLSTKSSDYRIEQARTAILNLPAQFPPANENQYTSLLGMQEMRQIALDLRGSSN
jgi:hypothetical protein